MKKIKEAVSMEYVLESDVDLLMNELKKWMGYNKRLYHPKVIEDVMFSIKLIDVLHETYLNIRWDGSDFSIVKANEPLPERHLLVHTKVSRLLYGLSKTWGGDALTIGYGLIVDVYKQITLEKNLDIVCIRLITRYPMARKDMVKYPLRAFKFYTYNPLLTSLWLKQKIALRPYVNRYPANERDHWLSYNKCDLCAVCKMPEIDLEAYGR